MIKFDLGGNKNHDGYLSVNLSGNPHIKKDILCLDDFCLDNSVDEFLMSHTYEHIPTVLLPDFISNILRKLKSGGCLKIIHTDIKKSIGLYSSDKIDFRCLRDIIFAPFKRRKKLFDETGKDLMNHQYMWGEEELVEELLFYGFSKANSFNAGFWKFDIENNLPNDNMKKYHGTLIPNLGVVAYK